MAMYLSMKAENGEVVFEGARWLPSKVFDEITKETNQEMHPEYEDEMEFCKDYFFDIQDIPRIIEYYEEIIDGHSDDQGMGIVGLIRNRIIPALKRQLDYQVSEHRKYIVRWD